MPPGICCGSATTIGAGGWALTVDDSIDASPGARTGMWRVRGAADVVGIAPDWRGRVWFAATDGVAGFVDPASRRHEDDRPRPRRDSRQLDLHRTAGHGDRHRSRAVPVERRARPRRASNGALPYDRGPVRKPGQLSRGTGATPTFFGPSGRHALLDDHRQRGPGRAPDRRRYPTDRQAAPPAAEGARRLPAGGAHPGPSGTENSPIGFDRSVYVASTYGYPYPGVTIRGRTGATAERAVRRRHRTRGPLEDRLELPSGVAGQCSLLCCPALRPARRAAVDGQPR